MAPQKGTVLLLRELEHEIGRKAIYIAFHCPDQGLCLDAVQRCQVPVENNLLPTDQIYALLDSFSRDNRACFAGHASILLRTVSLGTLSPGWWSQFATTSSFSAFAKVQSQTTRRQPCHNRRKSYRVQRRQTRTFGLNTWHSGQSGRQRGSGRLWEVLTQLSQLGIKIGVIDSAKAVSFHHKTGHLAVGCISSAVVVWAN